MNRDAKEAIAAFLQALQIDTTTPELAKTPERVASMYEKLFQGVQQHTKDIWGEVFSTDYTGLVAVTNIPFYSMCEHHLLPFFGTVDIVYQPKEGRVVGLSKFGDVVNVLARRPQLQERLTSQIADAIEQDLMADGVFIRMKATQLCMLIKGEMQQGTQVVTIESRGILQGGGPLRDEAIALMGGIQTDVQTQTL